MNKLLTTALAYLTGIVLMAMPVVVAVEFAERHSVGEQSRQALHLADEIMRRSDETSRQIGFAIKALALSDDGVACSPGQMALMRKLAVSASYLQGLGRIENNYLVCSSLGSHAPGFALGAPDYVSETGTSIWVSTALPMAPHAKFVVAQSQGYAAIVHRELLFDVPEFSAHVTLALVASSTRRAIAARGTFNPAWMRTVPKGESLTFQSGQSIVALRRSANYDLTSVAAISLTSVRAMADDLKTFLVPIGLLSGVALALAFGYLVRRQVSVPALLRGALRRHEFFVAYQPVVRLANRQCVGAEALLRWRRRDGSMIRPDLFIPIAEETGIITSITRRMLSLVARDMPAMVDAFPQVHISVNLSPRDLESASVVKQLADIMRKSNIKPANLIVEATERGLIDVGLATTFIKEIRDTGIGIAIDDFGTGYSCLSNLTTLDVDILKIDKSFVDTIGTAAPTNSVVLHIIEMAKSLNLVMVAEGVETEAQAEFLRQRGVQYAQGWLFAKPMSAADFMRYLHARTASRPAPAADCAAAVSAPQTLVTH
jgi:sensor c-di-GMP phosphodiesterase-like protein